MTRNKDLLDILANLATIGAMFFVAWAALAAYQAAKAAKETLKAQLVYAALDQYFQPEMADALQRLRRWAETHGPAFAHVWTDKYKQNDREARKVFRAKRHVKRYFVKADQLYAQNLIDAQTLRAMVLLHGI